MFYWRITKYNPQYRDARGAYLKDEWTCYSDIGKTFNKKQLSLEEYLKIEADYTQAVILLMQCSSIDSLQVDHLEKGGRLIEKYNLDDKVEVLNEKNIGIENIPLLVQAILRNKVWCKLTADNIYVHFGYDFYMYIGSKNSCDSAIEKIKQSGLFVENYESPYSDLFGKK